MKLMVGDMFKCGADAICVTSNAVLNKQNRLVMGRGAALQATREFPGCAKDFGEIILRSKVVGDRYGVIIHPRKNNPKLAIFQVKFHYLDEADFNLISYSTGHLTALALTEWHGLRIALNFPGIGNGRLKREDVLPLISSLPDNVEVWERR